MSQITIVSTTNYGKFKTIRGNREINERYLTKLTKSIKDNNLLPQNPIIVNERMQILDGQHRLKVAEVLGLPIYYMVVRTGSLREVQMLNTNVRGWNTFNFLDSYIAIGKKDYIELKDFSDKTGISVSNSMALLSGGFSTGGSKRESRINLFRQGDFKVTSRDYANTFFNRLKDIAPFVEMGVLNDREFLRALDKTYRSGILHDYLLDKLKVANVKIEPQKTLRNYIRELEDILSYKSKVVHRIIQERPMIGKLREKVATTEATN